MQSSPDNMYVYYKYSSLIIVSKDIRADSKQTAGRAFTSRCTL